MKEKPWSETIEKSLLRIMDECEEEDNYIYLQMLREAKQNELYWHGFQYIFWDERAGDFRIPTHEVIEEVSSREETKYIYDYVVNIFKAHGLSIIAALSAEVPGVPFSPMDADNQADVIAAQKAEILGKIIHKYNKSKLVFYHALFTLFTSQFVACYNYYERHEKFGKTKIEKFKKEKQDDYYECKDCLERSDVELVDCPLCSGDMIKKEGDLEQVPDGFEEVDRGMEKFVIKGVMNVKIPTYAGDQDACGYLIDYSDQHYAWVRENLGEYLDREDIGPGNSEGGEKKNIRMPSVDNQYSDSYIQSLVTVKRVWVRPWMYQSLNEKEAEELKEEYPKGCYFAVIDGGKPVIAEIREERLDDHWTITKGDLSRSVHGDPLGKPLIPMQDLENMLMNLHVESIEHSIPSTFADPEILDFEQYSKQEVTPGSIYPAKTSINHQRRMDDYFFNLKTSSLSAEAVDFSGIVESKGQFVVGAFPSIFGGPQTEGSKTLGEYQESRSYALQRLSIPYQMLFFWWADATYKAVKDHIYNMIEDEKYNQQIEGGKYVSIKILMAEFNKGSFSNLIPESAVDLPVSFSQKRSTLQGMIQMNSEYLNTMLFSPENKRVTFKYLGLEELADLDSNQTMKQLTELDELLKSEPIEGPNGERISSIPVEVEIDDNEIHLRVIRTFLSGPVGQEYKKLNPLGYENALLHGREHKILIQEELMAQQQIENPQEQETEEEVVVE